MATTSSTKKDTEATKLWHMRLGYASEKSLQILAKQRLLKARRLAKLNFVNIVFWESNKE